MFQKQKEMLSSGYHVWNSKENNCNKNVINDDMEYFRTFNTVSLIINNAVLNIRRSVVLFNARFKVGIYCKIKLIIHDLDRYIKTINNIMGTLIKNMDFIRSMDL